MGTRDTAIIDFTEAAYDLEVTDEGDIATIQDRLRFPSLYQKIEKAITPKTKFLYGETISNPRGNVLDIEAVAKIPATSDGGVAAVLEEIRKTLDRHHQQSLGSEQLS